MKAVAVACQTAKVGINRRALWSQACECWTATGPLFVILPDVARGNVRVSWTLFGYMQRVLGFASGKREMSDWLNFACEFWEKNESVCCDW